MIELNRILIQLNMAIECANSAYPQKRSIAVTLFDNLIEIQLFKKAETNFLLSKPIWHYGTPSYNAKARHKALNYYSSLLKFSKDNKTISERDFEILKYAHSIRNSAYHKGILDEMKLDLAILIYYDFIRRNLPKWGSPSGLISFSTSPGHKKIDFGQGLKDEFFDGLEDYFKSSISYILARLQLSKDLPNVAITIINKQIESIERGINFIESNTKSLNFYNVIERYWYLNSDFLEFYRAGRKPKNLNNILLLYAFFRNHQEFLDEITDTKIRQREGKRLLKHFRSELNGKYPNLTDLAKIKDRVMKLRNKDPNTVLKNFIEIENKIAYLFTDLQEASCDLNGYIQELIDRAKEE